MKYLQTYLVQFDQKRPIVFSVFLLLWTICTFSYWKKYDWNPSSMVNFGREFALQNKSETPDRAIVFQGESGDLGAGYDGQIFYYFSRSLSNLSLDWPKGFDESYRAPRIGYPLLVSPFGFLGKAGTIFGMYFWNVGLFYISYLCLRALLSYDLKHLALLYLFNPFSLGSYYVLVSDSVMASLVLLSYFFFLRGKYFWFVLLGSLAIVTKEPALFLFFPLGLKTLWERDWKKVFFVASLLFLPILWHSYLSYRFPNWRANRLTDFILPLEGIVTYLQGLREFLAASDFGFKELARQLSRLPLVLLFVFGFFLPFVGQFSKGWEFRIGFFLVMCMVGIAGHYHFWSVYENVSRMFTLSIPLLVLWKNQDRSLPITPYSCIVIAILFLFLSKALFISKTMSFAIGL